MPTSELRVRKAPPIRAEITVPGDKSISHRAVMFAAMSNGPCLITGFLASEDCLCTVEAVRRLGIEIEHPDLTTLIVHGQRKKFTAPTEPIYCGNSGTTMRLISGILAAQPFKSTLTGDESLSTRPMGRIIEPLRLMGAKINGREIEKNGRTRIVAPLEIEGGEIRSIVWDSPVASAQVKSAILLAGLFANGKTVVREPSRSRDHTEQMLRHFLVRVSTEDKVVSMHGGQTLESRPFVVPGDISSAAFWLVAAAAQNNSHLIVQNVGLNKTRTGILSVLSKMKAGVREIIEDLDQSEPIGKVEVCGRGRLVGTEIRDTPSWEHIQKRGLINSILSLTPDEARSKLLCAPLCAENLLKYRSALAQRPDLVQEERDLILGEILDLNDMVGVGIANIIDEIPILAVAAALAEGTTTFHDVGELRVKETDRIEAVVTNLRAMGANVVTGIEEGEDGKETEFLRVHGGTPLRGARLESFGDHRIAMAFCVAGMFAEGETIIRNTECIRTSYPGFEDTLYKLMRPRMSAPDETPVINDISGLDLQNN